jgi:hypothetical protein
MVVNELIYVESSIYIQRVVKFDTIWQTECQTLGVSERYG